MSHALALPNREQESITQAMRSWQPPDATGLLVREDVNIHALATISAGNMEEYFHEGHQRKEFRPTRSKKFVLHDEQHRAPGLKAALEETDYQELTIGFGWNDPNMIVRQRVAAYVKSATRAGAGSLRIVGDHRKLVLFEHGGAREVFPNEREFATLWQQCKPETWVYFYLAAFDQQSGEPYLWFPDNVSIPYRLRFGGENSRRELEACLQTLKPQYAIMPIRLTLDPEYPLVMPGGVRGKGPVWQFAPLLPPVPGGVKLRMDSRRLLELRQGAYQQTTALALPVPDIERVARAVYSEGPGEDFTDEQAALALRGGPCDAKKWRQIWFKLVKGSPADNDAARKRFVRWFTGQHEEMWQTDSLGDFLTHATNKDAAELVCAALDLIERRTVQSEQGSVDTETGEITEASQAPAPASPERYPSPDADQGPTVSDSPDTITGEPYEFEPDDIIDPDDSHDPEPDDEAEGALRWVHDLVAAYAAIPDSPERKPTPSDRAWLLSLLRGIGGSEEAAMRLQTALTGMRSIRDLSAAHFQVLRAEVARGEAWRENITRLARSLDLGGATD